MAKKHIICINGPPRCGKDTVSRILRNNLPLLDSDVYKFARPLRDVVAAVLGIPDDLLDEVKDLPLNEVMPFDVGEDSTYRARDFMIDLSENFVKRKLGRGFFGLKAARDILEDGHKFAIISDSGFAEELVPLIRHFETVCPGEYSYSVWWILRDSCDFKKDSRGWLCPKDLDGLGVKINYESIENNRGLGGLKLQVLDLQKGLRT